MRPICFFLLFFLWTSHDGFGQAVLRQSLEGLQDEELLDLFNKYDGDSISQEVIARTYLNRAIKTNDTIKIARGYDRLARAFSPKTNIKYADSLIEYSKDWKHITYPGLGYILKATSYSHQSNFKNAILNYIIADSLAKEHNNLVFREYVLGSLSREYIFNGNSKKAIELQKKRHDLILSPSYIKSLTKSTRGEKKDFSDQIYKEMKMVSLENFAVCYLFDNKVDSTLFYLDLLNIELNSYSGYLKEKINLRKLDIEMEIQYKIGNYNLVFKIGDSILSLGNKKIKLHYFKNVNLFKGLASLKTNNINAAEKYLLVSDSIFDVRNDVSIMSYDFLLFDSLLEVYKKKKDLNKQIKYLDKLIYLDSLALNRNTFFLSEIMNKYETPKLLAEKEQAIAKLRQTNKQSNIFLIIVFMVSIAISGLAIYFYHRQALFKKRFRALVVIQEGNVKAEKEEGDYLAGISVTIIQEIQNKLEAFESKQHFLQKELTLQSLAKKLDTNSNYLSRILNVTKGKNFSQYLNELRINYALLAIRYNPDFRKYTIEAIAKECGYNNATTFSRVFYKQTGIYPSYYIENIQKINPEEGLGK
ncbi:MAG: helix-turn-helix domain-containing protein [Flavobacteriaceae bacterium]